MPRSAGRADATTRRLRLVARTWSVVIICITPVMAVAHIVVPEPVTEDYLPIENLLPVIMVLSGMCQPFRDNSQQNLGNQ
jgi:hypothetical protein